MTNCGHALFLDQRSIKARWEQLFDKCCTSLEIHSTSFRRFQGPQKAMSSQEKSMCSLKIKNNESLCPLSSGAPFLCEDVLPVEQRTRLDGGISGGKKCGSKLRQGSLKLRAEFISPYELFLGTAVSRIVTVFGSIKTALVNVGTAPTPFWGLSACTDQHRPGATYSRDHQNLQHSLTRCNL
jgi:hypothetical protein